MNTSSWFNGLTYVLRFVGNAGRWHKTDAWVIYAMQTNGTMLYCGLWYGPIEKYIAIQRDCGNVVILQCHAAPFLVTEI